MKPSIQRALALIQVALVFASTIASDSTDNNRRNLRQHRIVGELVQERDSRQHRHLASLTGFFSEEDDAVSCSQFSDFHVVSALYCDGRYCDNLQLECEQPSNDNNVVLQGIANGQYQVHDRFWTDWISDENHADGILLCPNTHFVTGLQCSGDYCDSIRMECTSYFSKPGSMARPNGAARPNGRGLIPNYGSCRTFEGFSEEGHRQYFNLLDNRVKPQGYLVGIGCQEMHCGNEFLGICLNRVGAYCDNKDLRACGTTDRSNPPASNGFSCMASDECYSGCCTTRHRNRDGDGTCRNGYTVEYDCLPRDDE